MLGAALGVLCASLVCIFATDGPDAIITEGRWAEAGEEQLLQEGFFEDTPTITDSPSIDRQQIAEEVRKHIDTSVDPCENFYQHACGTWLKTFKKPADHASWGKSFDTITKQVKTIAKEILEGTTPVAPEEVPEVLMTKMRTAYDACIDETTLKEKGIAPMKEFLAPFMKGINDADTFVRKLATLADQGQEFLFEFGSDNDAKSPLTHISSLDQSGLSLPARSYYFSKEHQDMIHTKYIPLVQQTLDSVKFDGEDPAENAQLAKDVYAFEKQLANITVPSDKLRDPSKLYNMLTKEELFTLAPIMKVYFEQRSHLNDFFSTRLWEASPKVSVETPTFFSGLQKLLTSTPRKTLAGYLKYHAVKYFSGWLSDEYSEPYFKFYGTTLEGIEQRSPLWVRCAHSVAGQLRDIFGRAFVSVAFKGDSKTKALGMIKMIQAAWRKNIGRLSWLDAVTAEKAQAKLDAMAHMIGYPDKWKTYSKVIIADDHFQNNIALAALSGDRDLERITKPVDRSEWGMSPAEVNAYNSLQDNTIVFPAAILQPPMFSTDKPMAFNFGAVGTVMGHELSHGFDDQGSQYNAQGALEAWWTPSVKRRFKKKVQCVADQYHAFKLPGSPDQFVRGNVTLGEDLADNGGLGNAYAAYTSWAKSQPGGVPEQQFGTYSGAQLFFYSFGQTWCTITSVEAERQQAATDPHAPSEFRVNGAVSNSPDFAAAFQCKTGSKMNPSPEKKCLVWVEPTDDPTGSTVL